MNNFVNKLYVKALIAAGMAKNELKKMREEDAGLDIIVTIVLVAVGLILVGILVKYAGKVTDMAGKQVTEGTGTSIGTGLGG